MSSLARCRSGHGTSITIGTDVEPAQASPVYNADPEDVERFRSPRALSLLHAVRLWTRLLAERPWWFDREAGRWRKESHRMDRALRTCGLA